MHLRQSAEPMRMLLVYFFLPNFPIQYLFDDHFPKAIDGARKPDIPFNGTAQGDGYTTRRQILSCALYPETILVWFRYFFPGHLP